jgi:hypothetical protein
MLPLAPADIRDSFVNASRKEVSDLTLPPGFAESRWDALDFLGWRDPKLGRRAYVVVPLDEGSVGVMLTQATANARTRPQCSWCQDVTLPNDVVFFSARRAGPAGRKGDTVGSLVCAEFQCCANARKAPPIAYLDFDIEAARQERMLALRERTAAFARTVLHGA